MTHPIGAVVCLALAAHTAQADGPPYRFPTIDTPDGPLYVISGKEHPEAIPEYTVWRGEFLTISLYRKKDPDMLRSMSSAMKLSGPDLALLYTAADAQAGRDAECRRRYQAWADEAMAARGLAKQSVSFPEEELFRNLTEAEKRDPLIRELGERQMGVEIACREADAEAARQLMARLTPQGRTAMAAWIEKARRGITLHVQPNRMRWHWLPPWEGVAK